MMAWLVAGVNLVILTATLLGAPAPTSVGPWELVLGAGLLAAIGLLLLGILGGALRSVARSQLLPLLLVPALGLPVLLSVLVGMLRDLPFAGVVRAVLPYAAFLPVAGLGLLVGPSRRLWVVTVPLILVGTAHALYLLGLFVFRVPEPSDLRTVWLARITLLDPRTTLPLLFGAAILPLAELLRRGSGRWRPLLLVPVLLAVVGALSTQTRSQLAALVGGLVALPLLVAVWRIRSREPRAPGRRARTGLMATGLVLLTAGALVLIPPTRALLLTLVIRSERSFDTGRVADEWVPAISAVVDDGVPGLVGGIGAGQSFVTAGGEERTYVHNLPIYALVYFGVPGLVLILLAYLMLLAGLFRLAETTLDLRYLGLAALTLALLAYAQFFAVHKLFSFNLMLMLAAQALCQPAIPRDTSR